MFEIVKMFKQRKTSVRQAQRAPFTLQIASPRLDDGNTLMFGKCAFKEISVIFVFCSSIYNPIVTVLICGYVGLPFLNEPKGSAIRINSARRLTAQLELEFPPLLMRLFVLRSFSFL